MKQIEEKVEGVSAPQIVGTTAWHQHCQNTHAPSGTSQQTPSPAAGTWPIYSKVARAEKDIAAKMHSCTLKSVIAGLCGVQAAKFEHNRLERISSTLRHHYMFLGLHVLVISVLHFAGCFSIIFGLHQFVWWIVKLVTVAMVGRCAWCR